MDLPFLVVGGHNFRDSDLKAVEKTLQVAYISFISVTI